MNRRDFLKVAAGGMGAAALANPALLQTAFAGRRFRALPRTDPAAHLAHRITFGPRPGLMETIRSVGAEAFIEQQLNPETIDDSAIDARLADFNALRMSAIELLENYDEDRPELIRQFIGAALLRAIYSERQLHEMMVHFWSDHFNIYMRKGLCFFLKPVDDRDVIRPYALGKFRDLLGATAKSPAMLFYLDNAASNRRHPNENYARELMELHTFGVTFHYTEQDVQEVARCFTGWTIVNPRNNRRNLPGEAGTFAFDAQQHDDGEKTVLGQVIPSGGGMQDGETVLDILANHPQTAWFISLKLVRRFVSDNPPEALVYACADAFTSSGGDIKTVLRTIFTSQEFWNAPPKFRRPFEALTATLRALDYEVRNPLRVFQYGRQVLDAMDHMPFMHVEPDGYPDLQDAWTGNLLARWNVAFDLVYNDSPGAAPRITDMIAQSNVPLEANALLNFFSEYLLGRALTPEENAILSDFMGSVDVSTPEGRLRMQDTLGLLLASPAFQYR